MIELTHTVERVDVESCGEEPSYESVASKSTVDGSFRVQPCANEEEISNKSCGGGPLNDLRTLRVEDEQWTLRYDGDDDDDDVANVDPDIVMVDGEHKVKISGAVCVDEE